MAMSPLSKKEREELELLMPWYVNGTLDRESADRIETALRSDAALARSLAALEEDRDAAVALAEADELPASMEARFLAQLEAGAAADATQHSRMAVRGGLLTRAGTWLGELFAGSPRGMAFAAAAACLLVLVQVGAIVALVGPGPEPGGGFRTASGEAEQGGQAMLVQFAAGADLARIATFLDENGARIVDGPLPGGMFKLRFKADDKRGADEIAALLRGRAELFQLVLPSE
jgi:anti-sigma-K factor RskA